MKVDLFFKNYHLGTLTQSGHDWIYNSNSKDEKAFKENAISAMFYGLYDSADLKVEQLPYFIQDYLDLAENEFFIAQANIQTSDTSFEKLYKLSLLKFDDIGFYIGQKEHKS